MDQEKVVLGIDPDTKTSAWSLATRSRVLSVGMFRGDLMSQLRQSAAMLSSLFSMVRGHDGVALAVIEGQTVYREGEADPNDLISLAHVSGALFGQAVALCPGIQACLPEPKTWKGQVPKRIHHARIFSHYGIGYGAATDYCYPSGCSKAAQIQGYPKTKKADWKHLSDAIGLALYGARLLTP